MSLFHVVVTRQLKPNRLIPVFSIVLVALSALIAPLPAHSAEVSAPLFGKGLETFLIRDAKGKTPTFRVLKNTASERALAMALATTLNMQPGENPKLPVTEYIDVTVEELNFSTSKAKPNDLSLVAKVSGRYVEIPKTVDRTKFLAGELIDISFPLTQKNIALFDINSNGQLKFKFNSKKSELEIIEAMGHMTFAAPMIGTGEETIRFSGTGIRKAL